MSVSATDMCIYTHLYTIYLYIPYICYRHVYNIPFLTQNNTQKPFYLFPDKLFKQTTCKTQRNSFLLFFFFSLLNPSQSILSQLKVSTNSYCPYRRHQNVSRSRGIGMPSVPPSEDREAVQTYLPCFFFFSCCYQERKIPGELLLRPAVPVVVPPPRQRRSF